MGSEERVMEHHITNVQYISMHVHQDAYKGEIGRFVGNTPLLKNKEDLDKFFKLKLDACAQGALTNSSKGIDRNAPFKIWAVANHWDSQLRKGILYFGVTSEFMLTKSSDGSYRLPDLSKVVLKQATKTWYKVKDLKWGRIEIFSDDGISESHPEWVDTEKSYLIIDRDTAVSGIKQINIVSGVNNDFQVFNGMGLPIAEEKPVLKILNGETYAESGSQQLKVQKLSALPEAKTITIQVSGGEIGRVLQIQSATNITGPWKDVDSTRHSIWPDEGTTTLTFTDETIFKRNFYRVRSVNEVPFVNN